MMAVISGWRLAEGSASKNSDLPLFVLGALGTLLGCCAAKEDNEPICRPRTCGSPSNTGGHIRRLYLTADEIVPEPIYSERQGGQSVAHTR